MRLLLTGLTLLFLGGCASYGKIANKPLTEGAEGAESYSIREHLQNHEMGGASVILALSGGGTRAAALAYGVMQELRDTPIVVDGQTRRMLDEVDIISSVSGGSFTAAYYGLHGDRMFEDFESVFLRRDVQGALIHSLLNPLQWFSSTGRSELAIRLYNESIFRGATFADMRRKDAPLILINASDLAYGVRFSFVQEYFNLVCSDISSFPVASAVTASSAVPVLFNPVVLQNYSECKKQKPQWIVLAEGRAGDNPEMEEVLRGLKSYWDLENRPYAHFVDGGITDNLGLRAIYEVIEVTGGVKNLHTATGLKVSKNVLVISIDAATEPIASMDLSNKQPSLSETVNAMSSVQLHRYNAATKELMQTALARWAEELSTEDRPVRSHFVQISFDGAQPSDRPFFNTIPTSFALNNEQVDRLIAAGRELLRSNPTFQAFLADFKSRQ